MKQLKTSLLMLCTFTIITGVLYPGLISGIGLNFFNEKIYGSLMVKNGTVIGSKLIGQNFEKPGFFHGRPSAVNYDAAGSGGSNLGLTNKKYSDKIKIRADQMRQDFNLSDKAALPSDLLFASGSGLDPHISIDSAFLQVDKISSAKNIDKMRVINIIELNAERQLPFYGNRFVNVLKLNAALDSLEVVNNGR
ncbi:MAG: potassium-transporting ATPase subunit C [Methanobacteriales archaeon HGW-Methanobacteriales-2]|nr:MAG: potassium-transporting ATPase subunit C [Methanobacteriales archaeon HGW-Methanobacteriales-2]